MIANISCYVNDIETEHFLTWLLLFFFVNLFISFLCDDIKINNFK